MKDYFDLDKDLTKNCIAQLCNELEQALGDGYKVEPLKKCVGGFNVLEWPGKREEEYKRLMTGNSAFPWPWIPINWKNEWNTANDDIIVSKYSDESFYGKWDCEKQKTRFHKLFGRRAHRTQLVFKHCKTKWSMREKLIVKDCLQQHGVIKMRKSPGAARPDPASTRGTAGPSPPPPRRAAGPPRRAGATPRSAGWRGNTVSP